MIYLAITSHGLQKALETAAQIGATVWCGSDAMGEEEFNTFVGADVTRFNYSLNDAAEDVLAGAIETVKEHHPNVTIWVEAKV